MTSVTTRSFHEPILLLDEPRSGFWRARRHSVIGRHAKQGDGSLRVQPAQFVPAQLFHDFPGFLPSPHPLFTSGNLLWSPIREAGRFRGHAESLTFWPGTAMFRLDL